MRLTDRMVETITTVEPVFMRKEVQKEELPEGEQYYLEFLGVNASADVYVNGITLIITMVDTQPGG